MFKKKQRILLDKKSQVRLMRISFSLVILIGILSLYFLSASEVVYVDAGSISSDLAPPITATPTCPTHQEDDILIVSAYNTDGEAMSTATSGWAEIAQINGGNDDMAWYWKRAPGSGTAGATIEAADDDQFVICYAIRGAKTTGNPFEAGFTIADNSSTATDGPLKYTSTISTSGPERVVVHFYNGLDNNDPWDTAPPPAGWTLQDYQITGDGVDGTFLVMSKNVSEASTIPPAYIGDIGATELSGGLTIAFIPIITYWNQSTLDLGESVDNITIPVEIFTEDPHTSVKIDCSGNCTQITTNWTTRDMTDGQTDKLLITCSNATEGVFQATFNVTSDEDVLENNITIDCEVWSYGTLTVNLTTPPDFFNVTTNTTFSLNATVTCSGGANARCGTVEALVRYNSTTSTPDAKINVTAGETPFYVIGGTQGASWSIIDDEGDGVKDSNIVLFGDHLGDEGVVYSVSAFNSTTAMTIDTIQMDDVYVGTADDVAEQMNVSICEITNGDLCQEANCVVVNSTWNPVFIGGIQNITITETEIKANTDYVIRLMGGFNNKDSSNDQFQLDSDSSATSVRTKGWLNSSTCDQASGSSRYTGFKLYGESTGSANPISAGDMNIGDEFNTTWVINATGDNNTIWEMGVFFNSSYGSALVPNNHTSNSTVCIGECPSAGVSDTEYPLFYRPQEEPTVPTTYLFGQSYNLNISINSTNGTVGLDFNWTNYTASNVSNVFNVTIPSLPAGNHTYYWWAYGNGSLNNYNYSIAYYYNISKAVPEGNLTNTTDWTINYGTETTIGLVNNQDGDADLTYIVYRDSISKTTGETWTPGVGTYDYVLNTTEGQNWTINSSMDAETLTVSQIASAVNLTLNDIQNNVTISQGTAIDLNCSIKTGDSGTYIIMYNNGSLINNGTDAIINSTTFNDVQFENVTCVYTNSQNYTTIEETWWVNVTAITQCNPTINEDWVITDAQVCNGVAKTTGTGSINISTGGTLHLLNGANITTTLLNLLTTGDQIFISSKSKLVVG